MRDGRMTDLEARRLARRIQFIGRTAVVSCIAYIGSNIWSIPYALSYGDSVPYLDYFPWIVMIVLTPLAIYAFIGERRLPPEIRRDLTIWGSEYKEGTEEFTQNAIKCCKVLGRMTYLIMLISMGYFFLKLSGSLGQSIMPSGFAIFSMLTPIFILSVYRFVIEGRKIPPERRHEARVLGFL